MLKFCEGAIVTGTSGTLLTVLAIEPEYLLLQKPDGTEVRAKYSAIRQVLPPPPKPRPIQIGDRLRRLPAKRTPYPASWFGKDSKGQPLPDTRPPVLEVEGTVTGFAIDGGVKVRAGDGRNFRVSQEAIEQGEWVRVQEEN
jgi:hypothetical protein